MMGGKCSFVCCCCLQVLGERCRVFESRQMMMSVCVCAYVNLQLTARLYAGEDLWSSR